MVTQSRGTKKEERKKIRSETKKKLNELCPDITNCIKIKFDGKWVKIPQKGNSQALVRLCLTEVLIVVLLEETNGYKVIQPGQQIVKGTYSLFVDELTVNQESYLKLTIVNEIIVKGSMGTGLRYGIM